MNISMGDICSIAVTHSHCEGPQQTRRSLTTRAINDYPAHAGRSAPATPVGRDEVR